MDDPAIIGDKIIESYDKETKTIPTNFNEKDAVSETKSFYILLAFLLLTIALFIAVRTCCHLIKN